MSYNPRIHNRKSIRLKDYDYSQAGLYFLTLSVENMAHIFGSISNGKMKLNPLGEIAYREWEITTTMRENIKLGPFIIMPNHMHGIIEIENALCERNKDDIGKFKSPSQTIGSIIRGYKSATTKKIRLHKNSTGESHSPQPHSTKKRIWQRNYYDIIIRNEKMHQNISNYIINNPKNWKTDKFHK